MARGRMTLRKMRAMVRALHRSRTTGGRTTRQVTAARRALRTLAALGVR